MGKIRFFFAATLDGFIADLNGGVSFLDPFHGEDHGFENFMSTISIRVMGRGTYKFVEDYGSLPNPQIRTIVLTHRPIEKPVGEIETRVVHDFSAFAKELRGASEGDTWILGGGDVMGAFLDAGEVDVIEMSVVPVAIGNGIPMYKGKRSISEPFRLVEHSRYPSGIVKLVYERPAASGRS
jgi:dihydrofolate reductase